MPLDDKKKGNQNFADFMRFRAISHQPSMLNASARASNTAGKYLKP